MTEGGIEGCVSLVMEIMVLSVRGELAMNFIDIVAALRVWNFSGTAIGVGAFAILELTIDCAWLF